MSIVKIASPAQGDGESSSGGMVGLLLFGLGLAAAIYLYNSHQKKEKEQALAASKSASHEQNNAD